MSSFLRYWYIDSFRWSWARYRKVISTLESSLAIRTTLQHLGQPLFQDYTAGGKALGVIFRIGRACIGALLYLFIGIIIIAGLIFWLAFPLVCIVSIAGYFFAPPVSKSEPVATEDSWSL